MGARRERDFTQSQERASSGGRGGTAADDEEHIVSHIIERERRNLQRACALLDCLRIAAMYDYEEEIDPGDVAYVVRGLVRGVANALDSVALQRAVEESKSEPP